LRSEAGGLAPVCPCLGSKSDQEMSVTTTGNTSAPSPSNDPHPLIQKVRHSTVPIGELIGFRVDEIANGRAVATLHAGPQHANPMGTLHGGVLCDLADAAMGMAFVSTLASDESFTTMALSINFFRPVWQAALRAEARVVNRGKNLGYIECEVLDQDNRLVAKATSTCFVLRGDQARRIEQEDGRRGR
jgi:uncharacterized protein (TIGR00369 family)